jgi:hypothetical protein
MISVKIAVFSDKGSHCSSVHSNSGDILRSYSDMEDGSSESMIYCMLSLFGHDCQRLMGCSREILSPPLRFTSDTSEYFRRILANESL